jgi:hypothetical protein
MSGRTKVIFLHFGDTAISKDRSFEDCVILSKEAFDPDAVFLDDIVDDEVLPYLSLAVDGLTDAAERRKGRLELRPEDVAANEQICPDTTLPAIKFDPEQLEVEGWESSLWRKMKRIIGF